MGRTGGGTKAVFRDVIPGADGANRGPVASAPFMRRGALLAGVGAFALALLPNGAFARSSADQDGAEQQVPPQEADSEIALPADDIAQPAPDGPADTGFGNEIIVTATKREQTLQDIPVAVSVTTADAIERAQIRDVRDLQILVPSLRVTQAQALFATTYYVRGFGTSGNNPGFEPSVGMFVDGVYRSRSIGQVSDLPDIQRVEVLRGPQSTLFGKNASAGVISIVTKEPQFEFGGNLEASYGNFDALVLKGVVTGPLSDSIAASLSAGYNRRDGYIRDLGYEGTSNDRNRWFVRGQLKIEPNSQMRVRLIADYDRINEVCCSAINLRPAIPGPTQAIMLLGGRVNDASNMFADVVWTNRPSSNLIENYGLSGQVEYDLGPLRFTSITAWRESLSASDQDADFTSADLIATNRSALDLRTITQEVRVSTNLDGPFNFLLGGYYFNEKVNVGQDLAYGTKFRAYADLLSGNGITLLEQATGQNPGTYIQPGQGLFNTFHMKNEAWSAFGDVDFTLMRNLTATLGINYTRDAKTVSTLTRQTDPFSRLTLTGPFAPLSALQFLPLFADLPNTAETGRTRDGDWSYNARLAYDFSETLKAYVAYSTGFKASSFNLSRDSRPTAAALAALLAAGNVLPNVRSGSRSARPEEARLYELGIKGNWGISAANLTVFRQSIDNFQTNAFTGSGFFLSNAEKQSTFGIEFDGMVKPVPELTLSLAMTYLDAKYDRYTRSAFGDQSGDRIVTVPQLSATWGAQWEQPLANDDRVIARVDFHYESSVQPIVGLTAFIETGPDGQLDYRKAKAMARAFRHDVNDLNASLTYAMRNGIELTVWGSNLLDDRYITDMFDSVAQPGSISGYPNKPRTYGVSARYRF